MWLTLFHPVDRAPWRFFWECGLIVREAVWFWGARTRMIHNAQFLHFFMCFLSNHGRSGNIFVGRAISITHFAQVCALRAWRGISVLDHPFGSENWKYVHSTIPNMLLDNILDRLLVYFYDVMNFLTLGAETSYHLDNEMIIHNIKVGQTPISLSLVH